jgi:hypothetical protein
VSLAAAPANSIVSGDKICDNTPPRGMCRVLRKKQQCLQ